jgi:MoxR-like ATPase
MDTKTCRSCGVDKSTAEYAKRGDTPDGFYTICKDCLRAQRAAAAARRTGRPAATPVEAAVEAVEAPAPLTTAATDYRPSRELVATWAAVLMNAADGQPADNLLFLGPSGSGKTEAARYLAAMSRLPFTKVDAPSMVDPESWFGTREVVVVDGAPKTVYVESEFIRAVQQRGVLLIDEGNRVADAIRGILLSLFDDSRTVTNPLTGQVVVRHPECFVIMTGNAGLMFTGTYAVDPAFLTRTLTTNFDYLESPDEIALARSRTGCSDDVATLFVRFANEARQRAKSTEDFPPVSTREVLKACRLVALGLDVDTAARQVVINAASGDGGAESTRANLEMIWNGIRPKGGK